MNFPISYTGQNVVPEMDFAKGAAQASYAMGQQLLGAERAKLNKALQDEQFVLQNLAVNQLPFMSKAALNNQVKAIEEFKSKWANRLANSENKFLSTKDKMELMQDKQNLLARQKAWLADEQRVRQEMDMYNKDITGKYDPEHFQKALKVFEESGVYIPLLKARPIDIVAYFARHPLQLSQESVEVWKDGKKVTVKKPLNELDYRRAHDAEILGDDRLLEDVINKWEELMDKNPALAMKYVKQADEDNNGLDPEEKRNAMLDYAWDLDKDIVMKKSVSTAPREGYFNWFGKKKYAVAFPGVEKEYTYYGRAEEVDENSKAKDTKSFYIFPIQDLEFKVNVKKGDKVYGSALSKSILGTETDVETIGYDPDSNKVLLQIGKSHPYGFEITGGIIAKDPKELPKEILDYPTIYNGVQMPIREAVKRYKKTKPKENSIPSRRSLGVEPYMDINPKNTIFDKNGKIDISKAFIEEENEENK